jgi:hypothetical protein
VEDSRGQSQRAALWWGSFSSEARLCPRKDLFPFRLPPNGFLVDSGALPLTGLGHPLLLDLRRTITFAAGSDVRSKVLNVANTAAQQPR